MRRAGVLMLILLINSLMRGEAPIVFFINTYVFFFRIPIIDRDVL